eukprot:368232-Prymnesium_polylepis.1
MRDAIGVFGCSQKVRRPPPSAELPHLRPASPRALPLQPPPPPLCPPVWTPVLSSPDTAEPIDAAHSIRCKFGVRPPFSRFRCLRARGPRPTPTGRSRASGTWPPCSTAGARATAST